MMKHKYAHILVFTILIACFALLAACHTAQADPPARYEVQFCAEGTICRTLQVSGNQKVNLPDEPAKAGYIFNGWFLDEGTWSQLFTANAFADAPIDRDITVYAKYTPIQYALMYEPRGMEHANGAAYTVEQHVELLPATKEHYDFAGWFLDAEYTTPIYEIPVGSIGNLTLYAKFTPTEYKATFMDGETVVAEVPYTVETESIRAPKVPDHVGCVGEWEGYTLVPGGITVNATYTAVDYTITYENVRANEHTNPTGYNVTDQPISLQEAVREHYAFVGWYTDADLTERVTEIATNTTGNLVLYAKWTPVEYIATFMDTLDGETVVAEIPFTVETESITPPEVPAHDGYTGEWEAFELVLGGFTVNAKYTTIDYTITYEGVAPEEYENPAGYVVTDLPVVLNDAAREHYIFDGWYTDTEYAERVTEIAPGTVGDLVLYAKWTPVEYIATFIDTMNGDSIVAEIPFTVETESIVNPEVPAHIGYVGEWEEFELTPGGVTVNSVYALVMYFVTYDNTKDATNPENPHVYTIISDTIVLGELSKPGYTFDGWYKDGVLVTEIAQGSTGDVVLTAKWTPIEYSIKLHFDPAWGKYADATNPAIYTVEDSFMFNGLVCKVPGYQFDGWYTAKNRYEGIKMSEIALGTLGNIELYAHFAPITYTITYVGVEDARHMNPLGYTIESETLTLYPAMRDGYVFGGWYADPALSEPSVLTIPAGSMGDLTLYTKWTPVNYAIVFDGTGGELPEDLPTTYNITQTLQLQPAVREGYVFTGWFNSNGEKVEQILPGGTGDILLTARWEPIYYSINYYLFGGENPLVDMQAVVEGFLTGELQSNPAGFLTGNLTFYSLDFPILPLFPASKAGYQFEGWYEDPYYETPIRAIRGRTGDITLYAKWSLKTYTVTYSLPEGAEHTNTITSYTVEDERVLLTPASKTAWAFDGWYADRAYTVKVEYLPDVNVYGDVTLYAKFIPKQYNIWLGSDQDVSHTVTFNLNGGSGENFEQIITPDKGISYPAMPVRAGHLFGGWFTNAACTGKVFDFSLPIMGDVTLYAKWIPATAFIAINTSVNVQLDGVTEHKYTFVCPIDTVITVTTEGELDTCGILYDAQGNVLVENDDTSDLDQNMRITYYVTGGQAYTISVRCFSQAGKGTVKLSVTGDMTIAAGGKAFLPNLRVVEGGKNYKLPVPEARPLFKFLGWQDAQGNLYTNAKGESLKPWDLDSDVILQEAWEEMLYDVLFDTAGGSAVESFKLYTGEALDVTGYIPEKKGYDFLGWTIGGVPFAQGTMPDRSITLTAVWKETIYTVTYENTKDVENWNIPYYTINSDTFVLKELSKPGYTFDGWYKDGVLVTEIAQGSTGNIVLTAKWSLVEYVATFVDTLDSGRIVAEIPYTVETESITPPEVPAHAGYRGVWAEFELPIGGVTVNSVYELIDYSVTYENTKDLVNPVNPDRYTVISDTIVLGELSKPGYTFDGWYKDGVLVTEIAQGSTGDIVLTAKWTLITYTIKFYFDSVWGEYADDLTNPVEYTVEDDITLVGLACKKLGYVFDGWYTGKNNGQGYKIEKVGNTVIGNLELYAHFVRQNYTITYHGLEGANNSKNPTSYHVESDGLRIQPVLRSGYVFGGWFTDEGLSVPASVTILKGTTGDIDLYTKWTPVTYSITYDAKGGNQPENPAKYNITQTLDIAAPTKEGYVFKGWISENGEKIEQIKPGRIGDLKLVARWEPIHYAITYYLYGGENSLKNPTSYTCEDMLVLLAPTKPGYTFKGWHTDPEYITPITTILKGSMGDVELYAKWEIRTYKVEYVMPAGATHDNVTTYKIGDEIKPLRPATMQDMIFEGWYADPQYTIPVTHFLGTGEYKDLILYPKFVPKQYYVWLDKDSTALIVTFDMNGKGRNFEQVVTLEQGLTFPEIPVRRGCVFAGWYDNSKCEGDMYDFSAPVTSEMTLYAKWIPTTAVVTLNQPCEVAVAGMIEQKFTFVSMVNTVITFATEGNLDTYGALYNAAGELLIGNDDASGINKNFHMTYYVTAGEEYTVSVRGFSEQVTGTTSLCVSGYDVVSQGGKVYSEEKYAVTYGEYFNLLVPSRQNFIFRYWRDKDGVQYTDYTGKSVVPWYREHDVVLYPEWIWDPSVPHTHDWQATVTAPTCTEMGYTTYNCYCEHSYIEDYTASLGHTPGDWIVDREPTENEYGKAHLECAVCHESIGEKVLFVESWLS